MEEKKFKIGQSVRIKDEDGWIRGVVDNIGDHAVEIMWDDMLETCVHEKDEWDSIIILH